MKFRDYYDILGVARDASSEDIKRAFRKMARKYHPDVSREQDAEASMKAVNEAYAVLSDPEKRAAYDQVGRDYRSGQDFRPPPDWDAGFEFSGRNGSAQNAGDFSDFFSELFGRMGGASGGYGGRGHRFETHSEDHHAKVMLDLEDAFTGATRQITLRSPRQDAQGRVFTETRTLNVKIPKGLRAGQTIRLAGQGSPGGSGFPAGDLLLEVHFKPHAQLRAEGDDLHMKLPITPWEAALGADIPVALPQGTIKVRIPAGTQNGRQLRVRGKGLPGDPAGDLLLEMAVVLPPADTPQARALYETMAREIPFNPRG